MNVIIFGGKGFIGSHFIKFLENRAGINVFCADIACQDSSGIHVDIRKPISIEGLTPTPEDIIINLAAVHRSPGHERHEYFETNVKGAENVCEFAMKNGIRTIVFTSSISVYGASEDEKREETLPTPDTPYGISKLVAEKMHQVWLAGDPQRKLVIVRPGLVFGKGSLGSMVQLCQALKIGWFAYPGRKDTVKSVIYVKDLVPALWEMATRERRFQFYNCCYNPSYNIEQIVETLREVFDYKKTVCTIPGWILRALASCLKYVGPVGAGLGLHPDRVRKLQVSTNVSGEKFCSDFPLSFDLKTAFEDWKRDCQGECCAR